MKVFHNGIEWWVAEDMVDLAERYRLATGLELTDEDAEGDGWREWPLEKEITIHEDGPRAPGAQKGETRTAAEWVKTGPGFLCSTEY